MNVFFIKTKHNVNGSIVSAHRCPGRPADSKEYRLTLPVELVSIEDVFCPAACGWEWRGLEERDREGSKLLIRVLKLWHCLGINPRLRSQQGMTSRPAGDHQEPSRVAYWPPDQQVTTRSPAGYLNDPNSPNWYLHDSQGPTGDLNDPQARR